MRIAEILRRKGSGVVTVGPDVTVRGLLATLAHHNIGAVVVVSPEEGAIVGIASERDVVRGLHNSGPAVLGMAASTIMTAVVHTCTPQDDVESLRSTMTEHRIRHLPVLDDGILAGIVSFGDVVKSAIDDLETQNQHLVEYLQG
ncbi:MAG: CBS domain-containing protein [Mycobacteriaceae bacterium]|nr:CBS domain-containing protein [Mycobacteriaceae bacterium]